MHHKSIAVIGGGYWGKNLIRNFFEIGALGAISDINPDVAKKLSAKYDAQAMDLEEVLSSSLIEGVVISAPAEQHWGLAKRALLANKHVFVEKPLALKVEQGEELRQIAEERGLTLMVGHLLQYHPAFLKLKDMVTKGHLGKVLHIHSIRNNFGKIRVEENVLWSFAPHDISMVLALVESEPAEIYASGNSYITNSVADIGSIHINFKSGASAKIDTSWLNPVKQQMLTVIGDKAMVVFDDTKDWDEKLQVFDHQVTRLNNVPVAVKSDNVTYIKLDSAEPLKLECEEFLNAIYHNKKPRTDAAEGIRVLKVLQNAQESLDKGVKINCSSIENLDFYIHPSSYTDEGVTLGKGTKIWHYSHICKGAQIGENVVIGQNVMVGPDVKIANFCKIQNNVSIYNGVELEEGVFCGPSCVFTNVNTPRAQIERKSEFLKTKIGKGATIGANATIVCGNLIGEYSFIAAGAVVTKDVPPHALMAGVPAKKIGWVSHAGEVLGDDFVCPREGRKYQLVDVDLLEEVSNASHEKCA